MAYSNINKPDEYFNTKLYTGNGSTQSITGVGFQPDLVWIKNRSAIEDHFWYDVVRGISKLLKCNLGDAEATTSTIDLFNSFDSDGFTIGNSSGINGNGNNIASWNFKAGGTAVSNTQGTIASQVSANTTSGFSIVSYTGTGSNGGVGHGLGVAPKVVIVKRRDAGGAWFMWNTAYGNNQYLLLEDLGGIATNSTIWGLANTTSTTFPVGTYANTNGSGGTFVAYCFAEKKGFSKFGSYTGNGSTDGTFVYTGFKPAFVLIKRSSSTGNWQIFDNKRDTYNVVGKLLMPNLSNAEQDLSSYYPLDFISNGFKLRTDLLTGDTNINISGSTYIYMAFAENPLVAGNYVPTTAR